MINMIEPAELQISPSGPDGTVDVEVKAWDGLVFNLEVPTT
jgi:hypothetical protein